MAEDLVGTILFMLEENVISLIGSAIIGISITAYIWHKDNDRKKFDDVKTWKGIKKYAEKAQDIYRKVEVISVNMLEDQERSAIRINSVLEEQHEELKRISFAIFTFKLQLNTLTDQDEERINQVCAHIDWLAKDYFRPDLIKEARTANFTGLRNELQTHRAQLAENIPVQCNA